MIARKSNSMRRMLDEVGPVDALGIEERVAKYSTRRRENGGLHRGSRRLNWAGIAGLASGQEARRDRILRVPR